MKMDESHHAAQRSVCCRIWMRFQAASIIGAVNTIVVKEDGKLFGKTLTARDLYRRLKIREFLLKRRTW